MGRALAAAFPESRAVFEEADEVLGESLSALCFEGPAEALRLTRNTQPALLTVSVAAFRAVAARGGSCRNGGGPQPRRVLGAGRARGPSPSPMRLRLTRRAATSCRRRCLPGRARWAAVLGLAAGTVAEVAEEVTARGRGVVEIANRNGGGQTVIGGHAGAVAAAGEALRPPAPGGCSPSR